MYRDKFNEVYYKIIQEETEKNKFKFDKEDFNYGAAENLAYESENSEELDKLFDLVYELNTTGKLKDKLWEILQTIANNPYLAVKTIKKLFDHCKGGYTYRQLMDTLGQKKCVNEIPDEIIDAQYEYLEGSCREGSIKAMREKR